MVIGADHAIHLRNDIVEVFDEFVFGLFGDGPVVFLINPQNLLVVCNDTHLGGGGPMREPVNSIGVNRSVLDQIEQFIALFITPDTTGEIHITTERYQIVGNVGGSAQRQVFRFGFQHRHGRLWRNAVDRSPDVFIENEITHYQNLGSFFIVEKMFELGFHLFKFLVEYFADDMPDGDMRFLDAGGIRRWDHYGQINLVL